jgi:hypothetical protein
MSSSQAQPFRAGLLLLISGIRTWRNFMTLMAGASVSNCSLSIIVIRASLLCILQKRTPTKMSTRIRTKMTAETDAITIVMNMEGLYFFRIAVPSEYWIEKIVLSISSFSLLGVRSDW